MAERVKIELISACSIRNEKIMGSARLNHSLDHRADVDEALIRNQLPLIDIEKVKIRDERVQGDAV